jgi:uncharacterized membrane protein
VTHHLWRNHPAVRTGEDLTRGERAADLAVAGMGSWAFLGIQTAIIVCWIVVNVCAVILRFDPYPFILLNLAFSTQAAYAAPLILLAQRRQDTKNAEVALHTLDNTTTMLATLASIEGILQDAI